MKWVYNNKEVDILPEGTYGFIYLIEYEGGYKYIGKKQCMSYITKPALKNGLTREGCIRIAKNIKGKRVYFDIETKESNWRTYLGSAKDDRVKGLSIIKKTILQLSSNKINLTFNEVEWLVKSDVLRDDKYLNANIAGQYYKGRIL